LSTNSSTPTSSFAANTTVDGTAPIDGFALLTATESSSPNTMSSQNTTTQHTISDRPGNPMPNPATSDYSLPKELHDDNYQLLNENDLLSKAVEIFISISDGECKAIAAST